MFPYTRNELFSIKKKLNYARFISYTNNENPTTFYVSMIYVILSLQRTFFSSFKFCCHIWLDITLQLYILPCIRCILYIAASNTYIVNMDPIAHIASVYIPKSLLNVATYFPKEMDLKWQSKTTMGNIKYPFGNII